MTDEEKKKDSATPAAGGAAAGPPPRAPQGSDGEATVPAEELERLRAQAARAQEYLDLARRTQADFVNYQTRSRREREEAGRYALERYILDFLPVVDAVEHTLRVSEGAPAPFVEGIRIVEREMLRLLGKNGVTPIEPAAKFDPSVHDAVAVTETASQPEGAVLEVLRRGYRMHDRVLRPAQVRIAKPAAPAGSAEPPR